MDVVRTVARFAPRSLVQWLGRLQFKFPVLAPMINHLGARATQGENVMRHGIGRGLRFDSRGGHPGYALGTSDVEEQNALARLLAAGQVFYDIGANVGFFTTVAAKVVGPQGQVYGFEPFPASAATARDNAIRNGFKHVTIIEAGVSNFEGETVFDVSKTTTNFHLLKPGEQIDATAQTIKVPVTTIDRQLSVGLRPPNLVMIDVEGAEFEVLEGMRQTLLAYRPAVICEVHWRPTDEFLEHVRSIVGSVYSITDLAGAPLPQLGAERYHVCMMPC
jgi:FkbM family methyltransferase